MKVCYLQTIYGDPIVGATYIEEESLGTTLEDFVGPGIWRGERRTMTVGSDEDMGCPGEVAWNVGLPIILVGLSDRNTFSDDFSEAMDVLTP